jgi:hypothetical protein
LVHRGLLVLGRWNQCQADARSLSSRVRLSHWAAAKAAFLRRCAAKPRPANPISIMAQVEGSGTPLTAPVVAKAYVNPNPSLLLIVSSNRSSTSVAPFEKWPRPRILAVKKACADARSLKDLVKNRLPFMKISNVELSKPFPTEIGINEA